MSTHYYTDDEHPPKPVVSGSPAEIWLVYGELDGDATHDECAQHEDVTWCGDQQFDTDVRYVRADTVGRLTAALFDVLYTLEQMEDTVDLSDGRQAPNTAMQILSAHGDAMRSAIKAAEGETK